MYLRLLTIFAILIFFVMASQDVNIEVLENKPDAKRRTKNGDKISVHYVGTLAADGKEFDQSYKRGSPLDFKLGSGQVIKGWEQGLLDMAVGEKRKLTIPHHLAYGERGFPPVIPPKSDLVFTTELVGIQGVSKDEL